ncbi:MAG: DNA recombination protein RmuC, partial [Epsilonproteobacteria bacterium]|nr:DNA recombination protein RmuC [Campylobacterota bacterium]
RFEENINSYEEKLKLLEDAKNQMKLEFSALANSIFEQKTKIFDETHKQGIDNLLKPFREQIEAFSKESRDMFVHDAKERQSIRDELTNLKTLNERLSQDAINLTQALKGEKKTQGNWGEIVLERVLEESGLREGHEYVVQNTLKGEDEKVYRPDVIVNLPQNKHIVIDSKVSLVAYDNFIKAQNEIDRASALKAHIASINAHVKNLSQKKYEELGGLKSLDFVLLFMPIEGAFLLALESDSGFFKNAYEQNIIIVSPSTLLVTLRTIEHIWRREYQEQNAMQIAKSAEALYDKFVLFIEDMERIGKNIQNTQTSYDNAINKLSSGKGNLINRVEGMRKLGLKPKKTISALLGSSENEE